MSLFTLIRQQQSRFAEFGVVFDKILVSKDLLARGYVFLIDYQGKMVVGLNYKDWQVAIARLPRTTRETFDVDQVLGVEVLHDDEEIWRYMTGVFQWVYKLP